MSVVRDFILIVVKGKQCSERSQRFHFHSFEVKQCSERSQIFHFSSSEVNQRSERSQRFHFNSSAIRQHSECSQRFHFSVTYAKEIVFQWLVLQRCNSERNMIS